MIIKLLHNNEILYVSFGGNALTEIRELAHHYSNKYTIKKVCERWMKAGFNAEVEED